MPDELQVRRHPRLARDLKQLGKRFPSVERDLVYAERLLAAGQSLPQTDALQEFGERRLFKTRVVNTSIQRGKSAGYRLVYEIVVEEDDDGFLLLLLYDHKTLRTEEEVRKELRTRLES